MSKTKYTADNGDQMPYAYLIVFPETVIAPMVINADEVTIDRQPKPVELVGSCATNNALSLLNETIEVTIKGTYMQDFNHEGIDSEIAIWFNDYRYVKDGDDWWKFNKDSREMIEDKKRIAILEECYRKIGIVNSVDKL